MRLINKSESHAHLTPHLALHNRPLQPNTPLRMFTCAPKPLAHLPRNQPRTCLQFPAALNSQRRQLQQHQALPIDRSWGGELPDWELEPYDSVEEFEDELEASVLSPEGSNGGGGEFAFQNVLAAVLLGALALSCGNILLKLGVVVFALVSAALRYTTVAFLVIVILALLS